uniref:Mitochondrial ribonuclease P catalytic subunit n=1 Tax=Culicoides sonorensis TaxID=179676 RepID=A0A336L2T1_CULSO
MNQIFRILTRPLLNRRITQQISNLSKYSRQSTIFLSENQKSILDDARSNGTNNEYWSSLKHHFIETNRHITPVNIDGLIFNYLLEKKDVDTAKSYIQYLEDSGTKVNPFIKGILLRIYFSAKMAGKYELKQDDIDKILSIYKDLKENYGTFDCTTCENLILGLSLTPKWKDGLVLLEESKLTGSVGRIAYSALITAAFKYDDPATTLSLANQIVQNGLNPVVQVYESWIDWCMTKEEFSTNIETLFHFLEEAEIVMPVEAVTKLIQRLKEMGYEAKEVKISKKGKCNGCKKNLVTTVLSKSEFDQLQKLFLSKVLIRDNIFLKTDPQELDNYLKFIEMNAPYDCVIDGLNVAYSAGVNKSPKTYATILLNVTAYLSKFNKRILILGRKHMRTWPKQQMKQIQEIADVFYTNDISHDDPYLLYATLYSGPKATFCSRDLMRGHAFLLGTGLKGVFQKWRQQHQYKLVWANNSQDVLINSPCLYKATAHKIDNVWHIPFVEDQAASLEAHLSNEEKKWLCIEL